MRQTDDLRTPDRAAAAQAGEPVPESVSSELQKQSAGKRLTRGLVVDARAWGMSPKAAALVALVPVVGGLALVATVHWHGLFAWLVAENSLIESAQVAALLGAFFLFAWIGTHFVRRRRPVLGIAYWLIALWAFLVAGEEISWGQNLGFQVSRSLEEGSFQGSSDLHTGIAHSPSVYAFILISAYGTFVPWLALRLRGPRTPAMHLIVPPIALVSAFFLPLAYRLVRIAFDPVDRIPRYAFPIVRFAEWTEFTLYLGFLVVAFLTWRLYVRPTVARRQAEIVEEGAAERA